MDKKNWHLQGYLERVVGSSRNILLPEIEVHVAAAQAERNAQRDTEHLHPSDLSKTNWCPRATYYKITGEEESNTQRLSLQRMNVLEEGHRIHDKWQSFMRLTGRLKGNWHCSACDAVWWGKSPDECPECGYSGKHITYREVPIKDKEHRIIGHADGVVEFDKDYVIEIKSVGLGTLRWEAPSLYASYEDGNVDIDGLWKNIMRPLPAHARQVQLYMHCLGIHQALVLYEWKPTQAVKEFTLTYSTDVVQPLLDGAKLVIEALDNELVPDKPEGFTKSKQCRFCPYKDKCWK